MQKTAEWIYDITVSNVTSLSCHVVVSCAAVCLYRVKNCTQVIHKLEADKQQLEADILDRRTVLEQVIVSHCMVPYS